MEGSQMYQLSVIDSIDTNMIERTMKKIHDFQEVIQRTLKPGHDFGIIPGADKPSLLKPGSEKINMLMGITSEYEIMDKIEDYDKGFFAYNIKCVLSKNGYKIVEGVGNCNSREKKWVTQDPYSITNTLLKMAKKRAYVDATLSVASLSDIFTQDIEDPDLRIKSGSATHQANQGKPAREQVITFGKNKGKTLGDIFDNDKGYFEWLLKNNDKMKPFCEELLAASKAGESQGTEQQNESDKSNGKSGSGLRWSSFWPQIKHIDKDTVNAEAKVFFNTPDLQSLTEPIKSQEQLDSFLEYLLKNHAAA